LAFPVRRQVLDGGRPATRSTFSVQDRMIVVHGPRSHLYYLGPVENHDFRTSNLRDVMTTPGSNSGIYFHTAYQEQGFPDKGFEVRLTIAIRTGSVREASMTSRT
jgi:hypothetical protein